MLEPEALNLAQKQPIWDIAELNRVFAHQALPGQDSHHHLAAHERVLHSGHIPPQQQGDEIRAIWEAIYEVKLQVEALEGMILHRNVGTARAHEALLLSHIQKLRDGPRRDGALLAFRRCAISAEKVLRVLFGGELETKD